MKGGKKPACCPSRRQALAMMGVAPFLGDPIKTLLSGIANGLVAQAQAAATGSTPGNYLYIALAGGAPRWLWDNPLIPYPTASQTIVSNSQVATRFTDNGTSYGNPQYVTTPVTVNGVTLNMPWIWSSQIPTSAGGTVPMSSLLSNMLMIRGVNLFQDGHPDNAIKQIFPNPTSESMDGAVADTSSRPVPAVRMPGAPTPAYRSSAGIAQTVFQASGYPFTNNPLSQILGPFDASNDGLNSTFLSRRAAMDSAVSSVMTALSQYAATLNPGADALYNIRSSALTLVRNGIGNVASSYTTLVNKYYSLISAVAGSKTPGINDKPVPSSQYPSVYCQITNGQGNQPGNSDLTTLIQSTSIPQYLAEGFAVAEYLMINGYSSAVTIGTNQLNNLNFTNYNGGGPNTAGSTGYDEHYTGTAASIILDAFLYRCLSACLYEFISQLKAANLFNNTVIHIAGDFARRPNTDGSGSGHGFMGSCASILSGQIRKPSIVGNILTNSYLGGGLYATFGEAAPTQISGSSQVVTAGHVVSTAAMLIGVQSPMSNAPSLLYIDPTNGALPSIPLANNV